MRLRQELKAKIKQVLDEQGIYTDAIPPFPSIVDLLADAVLGIPLFSRAAAIENLPKVGKNALDMARKRLMLAERIEAQLQITPDLKDKMWERVLNWIVDEEEKGRSFDKYAEWYKAGNDYNRPKTFQIFKNPALIKGNWKEAQAFRKEETSRML